MKLLAVFKRFRPLLVAAILLVTVSVFISYFHAHPTYIDKLLATNPIVILLLTITNFFLIGMVALINHISAQLCGVELEKRESLLLTIYSSLANFFGPLQSGPGVRAGYLKVQHKVRLRDFMFVTLLGYGFYAVTSALFLVIGVLPWWASALTVLAAGGLSYVIIRWFGLRDTKKKVGVQLTPKLLFIMGAASLMQVTLMVVRYGIALKAVGAQVSLGQIISYTGAANFSLFVSITPDGIGIREAFLLFAQRLHGVSTHAIVAASLVDRAAYVVFLAILGLIALALHAHKRFAVKIPAKTSQPTKTSK